MLPSTSILLAIPTSKQELEQARGVTHKDYINNSILGGSIVNVEVAWNVIVESYLNSINGLKKWANPHGIAIVERADLGDLRIAARKSDVIVVIAHWKDYQYCGSDILARTSEIRSAIAVHEDTESMAVLLDTEPDIEVPAAMATFLNSQLKESHRWLTLDLNGAEKIFTTQQYVLTKARERLDRILDGLVVPGSRLELHDELHTAERIADCFDPSWEGFCDFACCHSNYLSETAKIRASGALFRIDEQPLNPSHVIPYLADTLRLITKQSLSYPRASTIIRDRRKRNT